jgi:integrase
MRDKLNNQVVVKLEPPTGVYKSGKPIPYDICWDTELAGFGALVTRSGRKSFIFNYRNGSGISRRIKVGDFPTWSVSVARDEARTLKRRVDRGEDPMAEERAERLAPTLADLADQYIAEHLPNKRPVPAKEDKRQLAKYILPRLGPKKLDSITKADIRALQMKLEATPYRANRVLSLLSTMFNLGITEYGLCSSNPCKGIKRFEEQARERFLSQQEIARLSAVLAEWPNQRVAATIRFLLLTGCRKSEAINAEWKHFDIERRTWDKPSSHTKQRRRHVVPLSAPAAEIVASLPAEYAKPFADVGAVNHAWWKIREAAGLEGVRLHDLRHSAASILASKGLSLQLIGAVLGHAQIRTTMRYSHLADRALQEAVDTIGEEVANAGNRSGDVVPLKRRP